MPFVLVVLLLIGACTQSSEVISGSGATTQPALAAQKTTAPPTTATAASYAAERFRIVSRDDEIISVLNNGLTVIVKRVPSPVVTVRGYVHTGGVYEGRWLGGGLSHLLEHLVAGGSTEKRTEDENRTLLQHIGNNSNAYTSYDHTAYFVNTTPEHMEQAVDLVTGWLFGALITPQEYQREYEVVQRELEKGKGEPDRQFYYLGAMNRYQVSPARVPVIGYQAVIQGLSRDDVYEYYKLTYNPNNMVFAIAGDVDPEKMLAAVREQAVNEPPGREFSRDIPDEPPVLAPRTLVATMPKIGQAKLQVGYPTVKLSHPDLYALDLLSAVLSAGESSLLVEEIRDKRRLVSAISSSSYTPTFASGTFVVEAELDADQVDAATQAILEQLARVVREGVSEDRVNRAKVQVKTARVKSLQTAEAIAESLATDYMSTGDAHFSDDYVEQIQKVTPQQIQEVAKKYFQRHSLLTSVMFPTEYVGAEGLPKATDLMRQVVPTTQDGPDRETKITRVELENGTILLHKRITTTPLVYATMFSLGGVTAENAQTNGLGNLAMKTLPRGTKTRTAQQIAEFFDSIGGDLGTDCGNNTWTWNMTALKDDFGKAFEVYADVVKNPSFPESELDQMKQRIVAAIESQDADWTAQAMRYFKQQYFGPRNSPYQFLPIGTKENVAGISVEQVRQWYGQKVLPNWRVLAIFGDIELEQAKQVAQKHLENDIPAAQGSPNGQKDMPSQQVQGTPTVQVDRVEVQQTQQPLAGIVIGFESDAIIGEPANFPIIVADTMTSGFGYPTGYLHEILRGRGLVYVVHAQNWPGRSPELPGTFLIYAGCDPRKVNEVVDIILENIARLQGSPQDVQADWFERSKQLVITSDAMDNETAPEQATTAALDELYGLGYDYHETFDDRIKAVGLQDVQRIARNRLRSCVVTISTPAPDLVKIEAGERTYQSFPPVDLTPKGVQHDMPAGQ